MKRLIFFGLGLAAMTWLGPLAPAAAAQEPESRVRFEQDLVARSAANDARPLKVSLKDWTIRENQKAAVTATGTLIVQVRAGGPVTSVVNAQRTERKEGEFFVVPAGTALSLESGNDTVVLTVLEVRQ